MTPTPIADRLERIRERRDAAPKIVSLYPTPRRRPAWVERARANRLYGDNGEIKAGFPGGEAA